MRLVVAIFVSLSLLIANPLIAQPIAGALSTEELTPFCNNKQIWNNFNVKSEQCLAVAVPCSKAIAKKNLDWSKATEELYACVFKGLGLNIPTD